MCIKKTERIVIKILSIVISESFIISGFYFLVCDFWVFQEIMIKNVF